MIGKKELSNKSMVWDKEDETKETEILETAEVKQPEPVKPEKRKKVSRGYIAIKGKF